MAKRENFSSFIMGALPVENPYLVILDSFGVIDGDGTGGSKRTLLDFENIDAPLYQDWGIFSRSGSQ